MKWRFFLGEAINSIRGNAATTLAAIVTVLIVTFLLGVTVTVGKWVYDYTNGVRNEITVKAYVSGHDVNTKGKPDAVKRGDILNQIQALQYVKTVTYVSPTAALKLVTPSERESVEAIGWNPYPPSFWIKLTDPSKASLVAAEVGKIPQVHNCEGPGKCVSYGAQITKKVLNTTKYILYFLSGLMLLLAIAAVVLIQNTIRLSIFSRRREIEVMKLVGATNAFVRLPFMLEGMITGVSGAVAALALLSVVYIALNSIQHGLTDPVRSVGVLTLMLVLVGFGLILGAFSSVLTLRRFLRV
jgi:cell division transport system permease protein